MTGYAPDPAPGTGNAPIVYVGYSYDTPAVYKRGLEKGERIRGYWFRCHVTAAGHRHCVLFTR